MQGFSQVHLQQFLPVLSSFCHLILGHTNLYLFTSLRSLEVPSYFMGNVGSFGQQGMQGVFTGSSRRCIKMISERNRDNLINIDMGFEQGEEFRLIIFKIFPCNLKKYLPKRAVYMVS